MKVNEVIHKNDDIIDEYIEIIEMRVKNWLKPINQILNWVKLTIQLLTGRVGMRQWVLPLEEVYCKLVVICAIILYISVYLTII